MHFPNSRGGIDYSVIDVGISSCRGDGGLKLRTPGRKQRDCVPDAAQEEKSMGGADVTLLVFSCGYEAVLFAGEKCLGVLACTLTYTDMGPHIQTRTHTRARR